jgi:dTDP-4-amino-4,6-dideoxygalactose transaminase
MIPVTKPFLPPLVEYQKLVGRIFERNWLTNDGPMVKELESKLLKRLHVPTLFVTNGTIALQLAIKALGLRGKIITTPFSYVATSSSIVWEGCEPVYVDIEENGYNIDADKIEAAITPEVSGILATHCFGIPCDVEKIQSIADRHGLKVIYDAAHAFGTKVNGQSIFEFGDVSTCSMHATKLFHTVEGGSVSCNDPDTIRRLSLMRNFGHNGPEKFDGIGINGKNSEIHAAMGLANWKYLDEILQKRRRIAAEYQKHLQTLDLQLPPLDNLEWNCSYYPIVFESESICLQVKNQLEQSRIQPRRYFYPSLNQINDWGEENCPKSTSLASRILCLPVYHELDFETVEDISVTIRNTFGV